jgi:hypothetical protein
MRIASVLEPELQGPGFNVVLWKVAMARFTLVAVDPLTVRMGAVCLERWGRAGNGCHGTWCPHSTLWCQHAVHANQDCIFDTK